MNPYLIVYKQANSFDMEKGRYAYFRYRDRCCVLAEAAKIPGNTVFALFAALSPNNAEASNWQAVETILECYKQKTISIGAGVPAYGRDQYKAWRMLIGRELPLEVLTSPKVRNFYQCILDPWDTKPVVVDGHMVNVFDGLPDRRLNEITLSRNRYDMLAEMVREAAEEVGVVPSQLQAVVWYTWKRLHGIMYDWTRITREDQMRLDFGEGDDGDDGDKFVQIAVTSDEGVEYLYALDATGVVFTYNDEKKRWTSLGSKRQPITPEKER